MDPRTAGLRLILFTLPFLGFGLWWALAPPLQEELGEAAGLAQALGVALSLLGVGAIAIGVYLVQRGDDRIL